MIHLYPSNKTEGLLLLLNKISTMSPIGVFEKEVIVVENPGMQHWLNLEIAKERGISMNMGYALPAQYLWGLLRTLAGEEDVPEQSPYLREVLAWRIHAFLSTKDVINDVDFKPATQYWCNDYDALLLSISSKTLDQQATHYFSEQENLKRYQLAVQLADLYEQYLIFRPQWLDNWEKGHFTLSLHSCNGAVNIEQQETNANINLDDKQLWQAKLWRLLIEQAPYNPVELLDNAIKNIAKRLNENKQVLPKRISFFGINCMAPMWLNFANALSEHVEVHFYHLNPCYSYWGDISSEKEAFNQLNRWSNGIDNEHFFVGNPLLASLGQQGREFLSLLQQISTIDISLFVSKTETNNLDIGLNSKYGSSLSSKNILQSVQNDILMLEDAGHLSQEKPNSDCTSTSKEKKMLLDDSITIVSCHSALREVQALHDYLLHQFNSAAKSKESLTPKDILVMCPQIEHYAPYVNAVFSRGWQDISCDLPPLPCSIADRSAKDSDPLIAAFSDLLALPDSRFQVSQLLGFVRLPAIANKFNFKSNDLTTITSWVNDAAIHWGFDGQNKASILGEETSEMFTWQQGLSRLLRGFIFGDQETLYQKQLLLPQVEGDESLLLGRLILLLEQLKFFTLSLKNARTATSWQSFLLDQLNVLFSISNSNKDQPLSTYQLDKQNLQIENSLGVIHKAISGLVEYCQYANYDEKIDLSIVVDYLTHHFSQGDSSKQFMVGQVTFCSMLPMRSIPFKVIAVLGLNDGDFPRQRVPLGFDLMANSKSILGDRSRRGDDRYLFLEALISARKSLYLSYQGRNIKNNSEKQPSIVLKELMAYLEQGYGWSCAQDGKGLKQIPMQAFSIENYHQINQSEENTGILQSFDPNWLELSQKNSASPKSVDSFVLPDEAQALPTEIEFDQLVKYMMNPSKVFAQQSLNLYLDNYDVVIDDVEPFNTDYLQSYLLKQSLLASQIQSDEANIDILLEKASTSGKFPDLPSTKDAFQSWLDDNALFAKEILNEGAGEPELVSTDLYIQLRHAPFNKTNIKISVTFPIKETKEGLKLVLYRPSSAKIKDKIQLYLLQLLINQWQFEQLNTMQVCDEGVSEKQSQLIRLKHVSSTIGLYFNTKSKKIEKFKVCDIENVQEKLSQIITTYLQGLTKPLLLDGVIANEVFATKYGKPIELTQQRFETIWTGTYNEGGLKENLYLNYFWPECPLIDEYKEDIKSLYTPIFSHVVKG